MSINSLINDALTSIFNNMDWDKVSQKDLCLVCKRWSVILESADHNYKLHQYPWNLSLGAVSTLSSRLRWYDVSCKRILRDHFIHRFADKLRWNIVSGYQPLSVDMIITYYDRIDWVELSSNSDITNEIVYTFPGSIIPDNVYNEWVDINGIIAEWTVWKDNIRIVLQEMVRVSH